MKKRRAQGPEFKAKVAMEAISGRRPGQEIAANHGIHPNPGKPIEEAAAGGRQRAVHQGQEEQGQGDGQRKDELFQLIGRLQMELEFSATMSLAPANGLDARQSLIHPSLRSHLFAGALTRGFLRKQVPGKRSKTG